MDEWFKNKLEKIDDKLDKTHDRMNSIEINTTLIQKDLNYHIKRTDLLEKELRPIKNKYDSLKLLGKMIVGIGITSGAIETIIHLYTSL